MYNPYGPQGNNQPPAPPPGPPYGPPQGQQYPQGPGNAYYPSYPGGPMQPSIPAPLKKKRKGLVALIIIPLLLAICSVSGWVCANGDFTLVDGMRITGFLAEQRLQATATYDANHYPFGMNILFEDDLSTLSGKWRTGPGCANKGGALHVTEATSQQFYPCLSTYTPFFDSHGAYTYEVTIKQMDASAAGLIFRGKNDQDQYYHFFLVSGDGTYTLSVYDNLDRYKPYQVIQSGKLKEQISFPLRLGVVIIDKQSLGLYANGVELANVDDDNAGTTGYLGVAVFNNQSTKTASADFVNARCWAHQSDL